ncbi:MAG: 2-hydroxyacyl-CoA dehydratase subunit D, partial [Candidatus Methylomirabilia bacterium]
WSERFFRRELQLFKEHVERFVGAPIDGRRLQATIDLYNENRALIWELYRFRKPAPPLITGTEMLELLIAGSGIPAGEFKTLLEEVKAEVTSRRDGPRGNKTRLLFYGCINDDVALIRLLEECAADVVMDDTCIGARGLLGRVTDDGDPLAGFTRYYFTGFHCPRTYRGTDRTRFDYLIHSAREFDIHGVVLYLLGFCDPHKLDVVDLREYLEAAGFPCLVLEDDYTLANLEAMRTRVQAFVEMIS